MHGNGPNLATLVRHSWPFQMGSTVHVFSFDRLSSVSLKMVPKSTVPTVRNQRHFILPAGEISWYSIFKSSHCNLFESKLWFWIILSVVISDTVECHFNMVHFITKSFVALQWEQQNWNQSSNSQQTPHTLSSWASYGLSIVRIMEKIDHVITAPSCISTGTKEVKHGILL